MVAKYDVREVILGRIPKGNDVLEYLQNVAEKHNIQMGIISLVGTVEEGVLGFYHQDKQEYDSLYFDRHMEIVQGTGNISLKDGKPFVHLHMSLGDDEGKVFGGHVLPGNRIFAAEYAVYILDGEPLERKIDLDTGLALW